MPAPGAERRPNGRSPLAANTVYAVAVDGWPKNAGGADWAFTTGAK